MLISKTAIVKWNGRNKAWYEEKEYIYTKLGDNFEVKVEDLSKGSVSLINIKCDLCGEEIKNVRWKDYKRSIHNDGKYYCLKCAIKLFGTIKMIKTRLKNSISFYDWCYENLSKEVADYIISRWDYELNVDEYGNVIRPQDVSYSSNTLNQKGYWFKCLDHPKHKSEQKNINSFTHGNKGSITCNQCNTISMTHPHLVKFLVNKEDALSVSAGSNKKILMKCPNCKFEKPISISHFLHQGFGCSRCSDGISFSQKFTYNLFEQLNKIFQTELTKKPFKWCKDYRYDFYLDDINGICECHGIQHYEENSRKWSRLTETQENDRKKEQLAKEHKIDHYIIIDCRYSTMEWIKNNIMSSELPILLNFKEEDINWLKCYEAGIKSMVKLACDEWNKGTKNVTNIAKILKLGRKSIRKYLKQGTELGWCEYDPQLEKEKRLVGFIKRNQERSKKVKCITTEEVFDSAIEAGVKYSIKVGNIYSCCTNKQKSAGALQNGTKLVWIYL